MSGPSDLTAECRSYSQRAMANERQTAFGRAIARGLEPIQAAIKAGYSPDSAETYVWTLLQSPAVGAAIHHELNVIRAESGAIAVRVLRDVAEKGKNEGARVSAARTLLEYAGLIGRQAGDAVKDPAEMSTTELRQVLAKVDSEIASRAKPVNGPESSPIPQQVIDLLGE